MMAADGSFSYDDAIGATSPTPSAGSPPVADDSISGDGLTLGHLAATPDPTNPSTATAPAQSPVPASTVPVVKPPPTQDDGSFSYDDAIAPSNSYPSGPLTNSDTDNWLSSAAKSIGTAAIKGLSNSAGMVGNISNFADYLVARGESAVTGKAAADVYKDIQAQRAQEEAQSPILSHVPDPRAALPSGEQVAAPILAKTGQYTPTSEAGNMAQSGLETAFGMVGPGMGSVAPETGLAQALIKTPLAAAPANIAAGAVGQGATDFTGDPLAGMAAGNTVAGLGSLGANAVGQFAKPFAEDLPGVGRAFAGTRDQMAGNQLNARATDPNAVDRALNPGPVQPGQEPNYNIVPGSTPTLGQLTNDMGILQAERQAATADNSEFNLRQGAQNAAQLSTLRGARPANADAMAVPQAFQSRLDTINSAEDTAIGLLTNRAQDAASGLAPTMTPEDRGTAIRNGVETIRQETKAARSALYRAVDPDGTLNAVASPIREAGAQINGQIGQYAAPPNPVESGILHTAANLPDVMSFRDMMDFDQRVTDAMKEERRAAGESQTWRRLTQLKGAVQDAINNSVENRAAHEARQASRAAEETPDTINQRFADLDASTQSQRAAWGLGNANVARSANRTASGSGDVSGGSTAHATGPIGTGPEAAGGFHPAAGNSGISTPPLEPNIDAEAAGRLSAAKQAHAAYARAYREGPVAGVLKTQGFKDNYTVPDSAVAGRAVVPGDKGYQTLKSFFTAARNDPQVIHAAQDHLVAQLAKKQNLDGTVNPKGFEDWQKSYGPAIRAMNEVIPGFSNRFRTAARATEDMLAAGVAKKQAVEAFNKSQAAKFVGKTNPVEVENQIGSMLGAKQNGPTQLRALVADARRNPAAFAGLQAAGVDWMLRQFSNAAEAPGSNENLLSAAKFSNFVRNNKATLAELYSPEQMNALRAVADDLDRSNRSVTTTRIKGSPGTAKDILPFRTPHENHSGEVVGPLAILEEMREHLHGGSTLHALGIGAAGYGGFKLIKYVKALRAAGIDKVQDAVRDALLNPDRARYYLSKSSPKAAKAGWEGLTRSLRRSLLMQPVLSQSTVAPAFASGGRVIANTKPSEYQKVAGNYQKGHVRLHGLDISIENPKGSTRSGTGADGKPWSVKIPHHYGYLRGTVGADGDHVDCYLGPHEDSDKAFIVDQKDLKTGKFDEHKVMLGFDNRYAAANGYRAGFSDGKGDKRLGKMTEMSIPEFKDWLASGHTTKPMSEFAANLQG